MIALIVVALSLVWLCLVLYYLGRFIDAYLLLVLADQQKKLGLDSLVPLLVALRKHQERLASKQVPCCLRVLRHV